jgi:hypothetical protein
LGALSTVHQHLVRHYFLPAEKRPEDVIQFYSAVLNRKYLAFSNFYGSISSKCRIRPTGKNIKPYPLMRQKHGA